MAETGKVKVTLSNVLGERVAEDVELRLVHHRSGTEHRITVKAGRTATVEGLRSQPDGVYRLFVDPPSYLPVAQFVSVKPSGTTPIDLTLPVDPRKVTTIEPPRHGVLAAEAQALLAKSGTVLGFEGKTGAPLYDGLDDVRKAGLLNIFAKTMKTTFAAGTPVLSFVQELTELRGDRFFAKVSKELREETKNARLTGLFEDASDTLHRPPDGFTSAGSFKTIDHYGNLQLTFFVRGDEWRADIDIDDANGLAHVFQVLRNHLTGRPTHPYDIHQLLLQHQKLDPGYALVV